MHEAGKIIDGLSIGGIYVLAAVNFIFLRHATGLKVYGSFNLVMLGAYLGFVLAKTGFFAALLLGLCICAVISLAVFKTVGEYIIKGAIKYNITLVLLQFILWHLLFLLFSRGELLYPLSLSLGFVKIGKKYVALTSVVCIVICFALSICTQIFIKGQKPQRLQPDFAFLLSGACSGAAGVLLGTLRPVTPFIGAELCIKCGALLMLAAKDNIGAVLLAGVGLGIIEALTINCEGIRLNVLIPVLVFLTLMLLSKLKGQYREVK